MDDLTRVSLGRAFRCRAGDVGRGTLWATVWADAGDAVTMGAMSVAPVELDEPVTEEVTQLDKPWITLVWNDPVNLMSYVTYVFRQHFGYSKEKATKLMMDVHSKGRAVVSSGPREEMERDVEAMHGYGLWATLQQDD